MTDDKLPPYPRRSHNGKGSYAVGPGVYWWKVWKKEYHDEGGVLGYADWVDAMKELGRKRRRKGWNKK
jgi:hypothetical protein